MQKIVRMGPAALAVYWTLSLSGIGAFYALLSTPLLDSQKLVRFVQHDTSLATWMGKDFTQMDERATRSALAWMANWILEPPRIFLVMRFAPRLQRSLTKMLKKNKK